MSDFNSEIRKGFLKIFILKIIDEGPNHGYDIIQEITRKSNGKWTPSPGSIYPALENLELKGYITSQELDRRKVYTITEKGKGALVQMKAKRREMIQELNVFLGDLLEEKNDGKGN
jgi:DNA-binding PadR family transcriptional regulator